MTYAVGDRVRVRADAPLHPTRVDCLLNLAYTHRRGQVGVVTRVQHEGNYGYGPYRVEFGRDGGDGSAAFPSDYLEPASNDCYTTTQPPTPVAKAPGSVAPPESLPGSLDAAECPLCHSAASRPSPIARRVERVVTDPIGAALIAWAIAVGGALWHFR